MTPRNLALAAMSLFLISHFLPAYGDMSGFACFHYCWRTLLGHEGEALRGGWFYYSGFVITNLLFIGLTIALFVTNKSRRLRSVISVLLFLHVLSWLILHLFQQPPQLAPIKIGYYLWLIAYALLVTAHLRKNPVVSSG
jgi:hypothetical protein